MAQHRRIVSAATSGAGADQRRRSPQPAAEDVPDTFFKFARPFQFADSAGDLLGLLDQLGLARVMAMGISAGGMTLMHAAHRQPGRIEAMVVIGAAHHFAEQARAIMRGVPGNVPPPVQAFFDACASRGQGQVDRLMQRFHDLKDNHEDIRLSREELATIRTRTLIVHGDRDEFFPVDIPAQMYTALPDAQLWIVPHGGHVPIFDHNARAFEETVLRFLAEPRPSPEHGSTGTD